MVKESKSTSSRIKKNAKKSRTAPIAERGITDSRQFAELMSALMSDLISGAITPDIGNATCNAGGKLLKVMELQHKYGSTQSDGTKVLNLVSA
jgi:hypothetical protein